MRPADRHLTQSLERKLKAFNRRIRLPGISNEANRQCLVEQLVDSIRRIRYILLIRYQDVSEVNINTSSNLFDPLKGAVWHKRRGNFNEAFWLVFLATHFGKNKSTGWNLAKIVYGGRRATPYWTWQKLNSDLEMFLEWLDRNQDYLKENGKFGNHRKYESCNAYNQRGTGVAITSYLNWIGNGNDHLAMFEEVQENLGGDPRATFDHFYKSMNQVITFGRTAKFDFLTMVGKLGLAEIEPGFAYLNGATGPLRGARLLFGNSTDANLTAKQLEGLLHELEGSLKLYYGMQVLEDALCNWQKRPDQFEHFSG